MNKLDALREGGFSETEIADWVKQRRDALTEGGFSDNEIEAYFTGGPVVKEEIPAGFLKRLEMGRKFSDNDEALANSAVQLTTKSVDAAEKSKRLGSALAGAWREGYGEKPTGLTLEDDKNLREWGVFGAGPIRFANEAMLRPTAAGVDAIIRGLSAVPSVIGAGIEQAVEAPSEPGAAKGLGRDIKQLVDIAGAAGMVSPVPHSFVKPVRRPTGEVVDVSIGGMPKSDDFRVAAEYVAPGAPEATIQQVQGKIHSLWERGYHPAEIIEDIASDPTIRQDLLSKTPMLPERYRDSADFTQQPDLFGAQPEQGSFRFMEPGKNELLLDPAKDGMHRFIFNGKEGFIELSSPDNGKTLSVDWIGSSPQQAGKGTPWDIGVRGIRQLAGEIKRRYPDAETLAGERITGGRIENFINQPGSALNTTASLTLRDPFKEKYMLTDRGTYRNQRGQMRRAEQEPVSREDMEWGLNKGRKNEQPIYRRMLDDNTTDRVQMDLALEDMYQPSFRFDSGEMNKAPEGQPGAAKTVPDEAPARAFEEFSPEHRSINDRAAALVHNFYTNYWDNLHPVAQLDEAAYKEARRFRGHFGVTKQFLENGTVDFATRSKNGASLDSVLRKVKNHDELNEYLWARAEARVKGDDAAVARVTELEGKYEKVAQELDQYRERVLQYLRDSGVLNDETLAGLKLLDEHYTALTPLLEGGKEIPVDPLANVIRNTYHYIKLARKNAVDQKIFKALEEAGFGVEGVPSLSKEMGKAMRDFAKANGEKAPPAGITNVLKAILPDDGKNISAIFDGKRRSLRVDDPELVRAIRSLSPHNVNTAVRLLSKPASWLRAGVVLDPAFMARNIFADTFTAFIQAGSHPIHTLKGVGHALSGTRAARAVGIKPTQTFQDWLASGGANATLVHLDTQYMARSLKHLDSQTGLMRRGWNIVRSPIEILRVTSELLDNSVRLGAFSKSLKKSGSRSLQALDDAAFISREATIDFARVGAKMEAMNLLTAFANVGLQGPDRFARAVRDNPGKVAFKSAMSITLPSMYLWFANHGNPRYDKLDQTVKDLYWIILTDDWKPISAADAEGKAPYLIRKGEKGLEFNNGTTWKIKKPYEPGIIFGTLVERALEHWVAKNPQAWDGVVSSMAAMFLPAAIPTIALPVMEQLANTSQHTGRTIIPGFLEDQLPDYQYTPYTTEVSKFLGHALASLPGVRDKALDKKSWLVGGPLRAVTSPILIENYVRAWTGGLGAVMLEAVDVAARKAGVLPDIPGPTMKLEEEIPFIRAFVIKHPSASTKDITEFYEEYDRNQSYLKTWRSRVNAGDIEAADKLQALGGDQIFMKLDSYKTTLGEMGAFIRKVYKNPDIPPDEQRQLIDETYFNMHAVGELGRTMLKGLNEKLAPVESPPTKPRQPQPQPQLQSPQSRPSINPGIQLQ